MKILETIESRRSVRNFKNEPLSMQDAADIQSIYETSSHGPFGNTFRGTLLHPTPVHPHALKGIGGSIGTYGFIKNAQAYAIGALKPAPYALQDFGYLMEGIVLEATQLGIGSCWLGGAFRPGPFGKAIHIQPDETVPAIIALGYPSQQRRIADKLIEMHHNKGNRRETWASLFFDQNSFEKPVQADASASSTALLRAIHAAPSSCNTQPWRIVKDGEDRFHFFLQRNQRYTRKDKLIGNADLQLIDMGIAMRHFEATTQAYGIKGTWSVLNETNTKQVPAKAEYLVSWLSDC